MLKLLKHLTNAPVAVALAFLLVGAPAAPVAKMLPSSGEALAYCVFLVVHQEDDARSISVDDTDCDGVADGLDPCPDNPDLSCSYAPSQTSPDVSMSTSTSGGTFGCLAGITATVFSVNWGIIGVAALVAGVTGPVALFYAAGSLVLGVAGSIGTSAACP